ncbi:MULTISPECIES: helix-turn-helix domain-containing protein [Bizionia]|uniref:Helix-turn-helix domain-containing protein n=1 Tax=Bizionia algoritergicola TaxID=291187 RepID=A0A5D0QS52_9FLAO|nr:MULTISPECIES: helix-turn-helix domain-containing protein [Bizionia]OBX22028.1 transcriptional regulator [Bizionia sp. APA-3]TYB71987.1 helix-turn-helix domain-containing protein [Bizionia algoritergicola]
MAATIITTEDLYDFKLELFNELKKLLNENAQTPNQIKKYLKSGEVMELLQISPGTIQNLRINGTIPYTKIGGIILYEYDEIIRILNSNKST